MHNVSIPRAVQLDSDHVAHSVLFAEVLALFLKVVFASILATKRVSEIRQRPESMLMLHSLTRIACRYTINVNDADHHSRCAHFRLLRLARLPLVAGRIRRNCVTSTSQLQLRRREDLDLPPFVLAFGHDFSAKARDPQSVATAAVLAACFQVDGIRHSGCKRNVLVLFGVLDIPAIAELRYAFALAVDEHRRAVVESVATRPCVVDLGDGVGRIPLRAPRVVVYVVLFVSGGISACFPSRW